MEVCAIIEHSETNWIVCNDIVWANNIKFCGPNDFDSEEPVRDRSIAQRYPNAVLIDLVAICAGAADADPTRGIVADDIASNNK